MTKRMILMLLACAVVFGGVFGMQWFGNKMMNKCVDAMPIPAATITTLRAEAMRWENSLEAIGSFVPVNGTDVTTESGGIVTKIEFESGATVKKGDVLISLDTANERADLRRLQAQAQLAELTRVRREKLYKLEAISKSDYDAAVSEANAAKAAVDGQSAMLARKEIRAPFDGMLGIRRVNVGQFLQPGTAIVSLQALDPIDIDFSLPEQQTGSVQAGYQIAVKVEGFPGETFAGEVLAVEPRIDSATRNFTIRARIPNPDHRLRAGQFGRVRLALPGERKVIAVPRTAINYSSYGTSLYVVQKKAAKPAGDEENKPCPGTEGVPTDFEVVQRFVKIGDAVGDFVAISEGVKAGEEIATSGLLKLSNQAPVIVDNRNSLKSELAPKPPEG